LNIYPQSLLIWLDSSDSPVAVLLKSVACDPATWTGPKKSGPTDPKVTRQNTMTGTVTLVSVPVRRLSYFAIWHGTTKPFVFGHVTRKLNAELLPLKHEKRLYHVAISLGSNVKQAKKRIVGKRYSTDSYRQCIQRACDKAGVAKWNPNRLRHSAATEVRSKFGLEAAQILLGHAQPNITQVYAERDNKLRTTVAKAIG
jgi:hypothetical protein